MFSLIVILLLKKNEIEKISHEKLQAGVIRPRTSPYSAPVVMVLKKEGT
jgi:hypothetical protein